MCDLIFDPSKRKRRGPPLQKNFSIVICVGGGGGPVRRSILYIHTYTTYIDTYILCSLPLASYLIKYSSMHPHTRCPHPPLIGSWRTRMILVEQYMYLDILTLYSRTMDRSVRGEREEKKFFFFKTCVSKWWNNLVSLVLHVPHYNNILAG